MAPERPRLSERRKAVGSGLSLEVQSEVWLGRAEFQNLTRPQAANTVPAPRSASIGTDGPDAPPLNGRRSRITLLGPRVPAEPGRPASAARSVPSTLFDPLARTAVPATADPLPATADTGGSARPEVPKAIQTAVADRPAPPAIQARPRLSKRCATVGGVALAFAGWVAWVLYMLSPTEPIPTAPAGASTLTTPGADTPSTGIASSTGRAYGEDPADVIHVAPAAAPDKPAVAKDQRAVSAVPEAHDTQNSARMITRHKPSVAVPAPPHGTPATPEEAYQWSAAISSRGEHWNPLRTAGTPSR